MGAQSSSVFSWTRQLPGRCQVCGDWPAQPVCQPCLQRLHHHQHRCRQCATPLPHAVPRCGSCLVRQPPSAIDHCVVTLDYQYPWDRLIARWKFSGETGWTAFWADLMWQGEGAQSLWAACDVVVPVPVSPAGLSQRGFNQAWELVKALGRQAPGPTPLADALVRTREVPTQHSLPRQQRLHNLKGVFVAHPDAAAALRQAHVLLVDDVRTTGATLEAAAQALLRSGAARVSALVLAHTPDTP